MIYDYYAKNIFEMTNVPTRLCKNNKVISTYELSDFDEDLTHLAEKSFDFKRKKAAIVVTQNYLYYAKILIKDTQYSIVLGPCFNIMPSDDMLKIIARDLGLPAKSVHSLEEYFKALPEIDLRTFLNCVILINTLVNNEPLEHKDLLLKDYSELEAKKFPDVLPKNKAANFSEREEAEKFGNLTAFYVKNGMVEEIEKLYGMNDSQYVGKMANNSVRQARNTFIVTATLFSRAAIDGGLDIVTALSMSDMYIRQVEMLSDYYAIVSLQSDMIIAYAKAVAALGTKGETGSFVSKIRSYIFNHIEEKIYIEDVAKELFINKSYLTTKFKAMTGKTLVEYVTELKINEAKRLLKVTDKSLSEISEQLAFSSQSYFQNVFKRKTGMTPEQFRELS